MKKPIATVVPEGLPHPFDYYLGGRNSGFGEEFSGSLGTKHKGVYRGVDPLAFIAEGSYTTLHKLADLDQLDGLQANIIAEHLYGGAVIEGYKGVTSKRGLYPRMTGVGPAMAGIIDRFHREVHGYVGPGVAVTSAEELNDGFNYLTSALPSGQVLRLKDANASDGDAQVNVGNLHEAHRHYSQTTSTEAVLMPCLKGENGGPPRNISVNSIVLPDGKELITVGEQIDLPDDEGDGVTFGGSFVQVFAGGQQAVLAYAQQLREKGHDPEKVAALENGIGFINTMRRHYGDVFQASVLGVDTLSGSLANGEKYNGLVADVRVRVGGTDPVMAIVLGEMLRNPNINYGEGVVRLLYGQENFVDAGEGTGVHEIMKYVDDDDNGLSLQIIVDSVEVRATV